MLRIDDRLGSYNIAAGEPWIMSVQMRAMQGSAIINWSARRLVLSFYKPSRELVDQIEGVYTSDASGAYFAFVRDGRFSEGLYGQSLQVELAERLQDGRAIISTGPLAIAPTSNGVASFGSVIGRVDARFTLYFDNAGLISLIEQDLLPYGGTPVTPAPVITTPAAISNDGTPQIGESFTGVLPTGTGFRSVTAQWLRGATVLSTLGTSAYVGDFLGDLTFEATIAGNDGSTLKSRSTITVTAATTKVTITGTPPTNGQVGTAYSFTPVTANGSGTKTFALSGGSLLAGLAFSTSTGAITGTPTAAGLMTGLAITVTDSTGSASLPAFSVTIAAAAQPVPAFSFTGPATIAEGDPSSAQYGFAGPATIAEGN